MIIAVGGEGTDAQGVKVTCLSPSRRPRWGGEGGGSLTSLRGWGGAELLASAQGLPGILTWHWISGRRHEGVCGLSVILGEHD